VPRLYVVAQQLREDGMSKRLPQTEVILRLLQNQPEGITAFDALRWAECLRLAARISDLRREGYDITSTLETTSNGARIARYRLNDEKGRRAFAQRMGL
jgi:hypothetical protein